MGDTQEEINSFLAKVVNMSYPYWMTSRI
jgi:hypothetical protein